VEVAEFSSAGGLDTFRSEDGGFSNKTELQI